MEDTNEKVLFEICCKVNFKRQITFQLFIFKQRYLKIFILLLLFWFFMLTISFFNEDVKISYVLFIIGVLWIPICMLYNTLNEIMSCEDIPDKYIFYSDRIENSDFRENNTFYVDKIKGAYETEDYFYIHMNKNEYGIIDKD